MLINVYLSRIMKKLVSFYFGIDCVQEIKESLFSVTSKAELKNVADKYNSKEPPSLTSQFTERLKKPETVKNFREREKRDVTQLYPYGWNHIKVNNVQKEYLKYCMKLDVPFVKINF